MKDIYLYEDGQVLINKLGIRNQQELDDAEADYVTYRLKNLALHPLKGSYNYEHFLQMHYYIFQDIYEWAGQQRKLNIYKEEPVLGGLSVDYSDFADIQKDASQALNEMTDTKWHELSQVEKAKNFSKSMAKLWKVHCFREGNTRTTITFCCQYADENGFPVNRALFEQNSQYVRTALVAYNAVFEDLGDLSKKEYLEQIVLDAISGDS